MVAGVYASSGNARKLSFLGPAGAPSKAVRTMHVCAMFERRQWRRSLPVQNTASKQSAARCRLKEAYLVLTGTGEAPFNMPE